MSLTTVQPSPAIPLAADVVAAEEYQSLNGGNTRRIKLYFHQRFRSIGKEICEGLWKSREGRVMPRLESSTQGAPGRRLRQ